MAFSIQDALEDIPQVLVLIQKLETGVRALPPVPQRKVSDITKLAASLLPDIGTLADEVEAQIKAGTPPTKTPATT